MQQALRRVISMYCAEADTQHRAQLLMAAVSASSAAVAVCMVTAQWFDRHAAGRDSTSS
jgi:hypothetical protein